MGFVQPGWSEALQPPKKTSPPGSEIIPGKSPLGTSWIWNHSWALSYEITEILGGRVSWAEVTTLILAGSIQYHIPPFSHFPASIPTGRHSSFPKHCVTTAGSRVKMDKIQSKITEELPWVYLCSTATHLHLEIKLNLKAALKIPSPCYSTQHNIIQIKIYFTSYCKQQQGGCGEQLEP